MNYQTLKQSKNDLLTAFHNSNLENITFLDSLAHDALLTYIDEYEELTRKMLQYIKQLENNDQEDRKWLEHYLSLGE